MVWRSFFFLCVFFSRVLYCQDINNIRNIISYLENHDPEINTCFDVVEDEKDLMNQCAIDLCGESGTIDSAYLTDKEYEDNYRDEELVRDYEKSKPILKKYVKTFYKKVESNVGEIKKRWDNYNTSSLKPFSNSELSKIAQSELESHLNIEIRKDDRGGRSLSLTWLPSAKGIDPKLKNNYISFRKEQIKNSYMEGIKSGYITLGDVPSLMIRDLNKIIGKIDSQIESNPSGQKTELLELKTMCQDSKNQIEMLLKEKSFDRVNIDQYRKEIANLLSSPYLKDLNFKAYSSSAEEKFNCTGRCRIFVSKKIEKMMSAENLNKVLKQTKENEDEDGKHIRNCEYYWHGERLKKSSLSNKKKIVEEIPKIIKKIESRFLVKLSKESQKVLRKELKNLEHRFDNNADLSKWSGYKLNKWKMKIKSSADSNPLSFDKSKSFYDDYKTIENYFNKEGKVRLRHKLSQCSGATYIGDDYFNPKDNLGKEKDYVHISPFSCNHSKIGRQVLAHEMGHFINHLFARNKKISQQSRAKYLGYRKCIGGTYKNSAFAAKGMFVGGILHGDDTKYTEEDMADFISQVAFKDSDDGLYNCSFLERDENNVDYKPRDLHILNPRAKDVHSSSLLRVLKEAIFKERILTPPCLKIIDKYRDHINFNKCEVK